ncbi:MAG: hypothetical protein M1818_002251 [Claussenomyces sp. TS43310]|nr:MAG: hypothetical protein M1818_002251 [Claussenomyces sp. TS43310]
MLRTSPRASTFWILVFILVILYTVKFSQPSTYLSKPDIDTTASAREHTTETDVDVAQNGEKTAQSQIVPPEPILLGPDSQASVPPPSAVEASDSKTSTAQASASATADVTDWAALWNTTDFTPFLTGKKVAAIIEDRPLDSLMPVILHFSSVLGPEWPIVLFTSMDIAPNSAPIQRALKEKRLFIEPLPPSVHFSSHKSVSAFLTKPWLWNRLAPADHVLLFQVDSMICANSPQRVEDFVEYDFVGAPIDTTRFGTGYNGGFSLRNRNLLLDIIYSADFDDETLAEDGGQDVKFEDQWFFKKMKELPERLSPSGNGVMVPGANLPPEEIAMKFAVETIIYDWPLGYHQPGRYQPTNMEQIEKWCPEVRMCSDDLIVDRGKEKQKQCQEQLDEQRAKTWQDLKKEEEERIEEERKQAEEEIKRLEAELIEFEGGQKPAEEGEQPGEDVEQKAEEEDQKKGWGDWWFL